MTFERQPSPAERDDNPRGRESVHIQRYQEYDDGLETNVWVEEGIDPKTGALLWRERFVFNPEDPKGERVVIDYEEYPSPQEVLEDAVQEAEERSKRGDTDSAMH